MIETESTPNGVDRRRSQRIPFSLPVYMMGLHPSFSFVERCEIVEISSHGCQLLGPRPLPRHTRVRLDRRTRDRKSTRLNSSHSQISYAVFCLKKKKNTHTY